MITISSRHHALLAESARRRRRGQLSLAAPRLSLAVRHARRKRHSTGEGEVRAIDPIVQLGVAWLGACLSLKRLDAGGSVTTRRDTSSRALTTRSSALSSATVSQRCGDPRHAIDRIEAVGLSWIRFASFWFPSVRRGAARRSVAWRGVVWRDAARDAAAARGYWAQHPRIRARARALSVTICARSIGSVGSIGFGLVRFGSVRFSSVGSAAARGAAA